MIYFLVNNNYHMLDVFEHCKNIKKYDKSLIQVPHTLSVLESDENFTNVLTYNTPFSDIKSYLNIFRIRKTESLIKKTLIVNPNDILFVYTEYEVLNQYIINIFKKAGAKVYVIEDGGLPTYLTYGVRNDSALPFKQKIKIFCLKHILGYRFVEYLYYNKIVFPQINEKYIDGVILYLDVNIIRNIKKYVIKKNTKKLKLDTNKAVYLNEKMYTAYCSLEEYIQILDNILLNMSQKFEKVYFKFHPRETEENKRLQIEIILRYKNVIIIQENTPIENLLEKYDARYVFSFMSAALLNVNSLGAIPVYIYHLYNKMSENNVFKQIDLILKQASYKFLDSYKNIGEVGFTSTLNDCKHENLNHLLERLINENP